MIVDAPDGEEVFASARATAIGSTPKCCRKRRSSAEIVAYGDPPAQQSNIPVGEFRSMLIDVFGRAYPEKKFFLVDRDAVARYKARVHRNVAKVSARIGSILSNVAVAA